VDSTLANEVIPGVRATPMGGTYSKTLVLERPIQAIWRISYSM